MLPEYTPELARELRAAAGLSGDEMAAACGLGGQYGRQAWSKIESGRAPSAQTWLLALIVAGRHPVYGPLSGASNAP